jgi:hypothetical protein
MKSIHACLAIIALFPIACTVADGTDGEEAIDESEDAIECLACNPPATPEDDCATLFADAQKALAAAQSCNLLSASAMKPCQDIVPTIVGCGAPVAFGDSAETNAYLKIYEAYASHCPMPDSPCFVTEGPGECVPGTNDNTSGMCAVVAASPTDA